MTLRRAAEEDAAALADLHAQAFDAPWDAEALGAFLRAREVTTLIADAPGPAGFVMIRTIVDQAEVLTLAVAPAARRQGVARALMTAAAALAQGAGAASLFLEVAADNTSALALYASLNFEDVGVRRAYYKRSHGGAVDAHAMRLALNSGGR